MLVVCCLMMARHTVEFMIHGYHKCYRFKSELELLKYCNIVILTLILTQNKLKCTSCCCTPHVTKNGKLAKKLANCCDLPNSPKFFPLQSFLLYSNHVCMHIHILIRNKIIFVLACICESSYYQYLFYGTV